MTTIADIRVVDEEIRTQAGELIELRARRRKLIAEIVQSGAMTADEVARELGVKPTAIYMTIRRAR